MKEEREDAIRRREAESQRWKRSSGEGGNYDERAGRAALPPRAHRAMTFSKLISSAWGTPSSIVAKVRPSKRSGVCTVYPELRSSSAKATIPGQSQRVIEEKNFGHFYTRIFSTARTRSSSVAARPGGHVNLVARARFPEICRASTRRWGYRPAPTLG